MLELIPFSLLVFYLMPFFAAVARNHDGAMTILMVNLLLGWTIVGWFVLLAVVLSSSSKGLVSSGRGSHQA